MDRLDLNATFTKINLWKQTQFRKILYVDADVVSLRAPDELFDLDSDFAVCLWDLPGSRTMLIICVSRPLLISDGPTASTAYVYHPLSKLISFCDG